MHDMRCTNPANQVHMNVFSWFALVWIAVQFFNDDNLFLEGAVAACFGDFHESSATVPVT